VVKLEAMKMTNAIKAPQDAVVAEVRAQAGQAVGYGDVLVVFQEA
jgi:biotin carboxyl carrier protein